MTRVGVGNNYQYWLIIDRIHETKLLSRFYLTLDSSLERGLVWGAEKRESPKWGMCGGRGIIEWRNELGCIWSPTIMIMDITIREM